MQNDYFNNIITANFENTKFKFNPNIKMKINANKVVVYNGLVIPRSKLFLDKFKVVTLSIALCDIVIVY